MRKNCELLISLLTIAAAKEIEFPVESHSSISLGEFNTILLTDVVNEFGVRSLTPDTSEQLWKEFIENAWLAAELKEVEDETRLDRTRTRKQASSPFIICDMAVGKRGEDSVETIKAILDKPLIVSKLSRLVS